MDVPALNGNPRKRGNTSTLIMAVLEGVWSADAKTTEIWLCQISLNDCAGCLSRREIN